MRPMGKLETAWEPHEDCSQSHTEDSGWEREARQELQGRVSDPSSDLETNQMRGDT